MARLFIHLFRYHLLFQTTRQVFVVIMERDADEVLFPVFLYVVGHKGVRDVVRHHNGPVYGAYKGIQLVVLVSEGIEASDKAAHTGAGDHIYRDAQLFDIFYYAQVGQAACAASGKHQAHRRAVLPYGIHTFPDFCKRKRVSLRGRALKNLGLCRQAKAKEKEYCSY